MGFLKTFLQKEANRKNKSEQFWKQNTVSSKDIFIIMFERAFSFL